MSLYADYKREREGKQVIEDKDTFIVYSIEGEVLYIEDIYVVPEKRKTGLARKLSDYVVGLGKLKGCTKVYGSVVPSANNSHDSLLALLAFGMTLKGVGPNIIYFAKEI